MDEIESKLRNWELSFSRNPVFVNDRKYLREAEERGVSLALVGDGSNWREVEKSGIRELWIQDYVLENFATLGFKKIEGPYRIGPDFKVWRSRRMDLAEVETDWSFYIQHDHHRNPSFDSVKYLIVLSAREPSKTERLLLPEIILHIDHAHFLGWAKKSGKMLNLRLSIIGRVMQEYWVTICPESERDMAVCPDCDSCAYFGNGEFGEAGPFFKNQAAEFIADDVATVWDFTKIRSTKLKQFVEKGIANL